MKPPLSKLYDYETSMFAYNHEAQMSTHYHETFIRVYNHKTSMSSCYHETFQPGWNQLLD